jgi:DNA processing protein
MIQQLETMPECLAGLKSPPRRLYLRAASEQAFSGLLRRRRIAIVGSRQMSDYGSDITHKLSSELAAAGIVVVSGLAIGVDAVAHRAALKAGGQTLAVLPSPVEKVYPTAHWRLAESIIRHDGVLVSEYHPTDTIAWRSNFVARNRIVSGLADALLITEATAGSGTLHTAKFALEQGKKVFVVPGNVTSPTSFGTNNLLKAGKATAVTSAEDVLNELANIKLDIGDVIDLPKQRTIGSNDQEQHIIDLLEQGIHKTAALLAASGMEVTDFNCHLTMLEIGAKIRPLGSDSWILA